MQQLEKNRRRKKIIIISIASLVGVGLIIGGLYLYRKQKTKTYTPEEVFNLLLENQEPFVPTPEQEAMFTTLLENQEPVIPTPEQEEVFNMLLNGTNQ